MSAVTSANPTQSNGEKIGTPTSGAPRQPFLSIRPRAGWVPINIREIWAFRDLLVSLGVRDTKLRYRQTLLGVAWVLIQPLMAAGIFTVVFGMIANLPSIKLPSGVMLPYFFLSYAGQLGWTVFSSTLGKTGGSLLANAALVSKVYFPRLMLPLSTVFSTMVDFAVGLALLLVIMPFFGVPFSPALLLLPIWLVLLLMLSMGIGLYSAALGVSYRDVNYILPVMTQMLMFASPVAYTMSSDRVPAYLRKWIMLNPLSSILEDFRVSLLGGGNISMGWTLYSAICCFAVFIAGCFAFRRMERKFADLI